MTDGEAGSGMVRAEGRNHRYAYDLSAMYDRTDCGLWVHADPATANFPGHVALEPATGPVDCPGCLKAAR